jgi:hypothetical protein
VALLDDRDTWEGRLRRAILQAQQDQIDRLMAALGARPGVENVPDSFWTGMAADLSREVQPVLADVYVDSARQLVSTLPAGLRVDWHIANEPAAAWAEHYAFDLVRGINATSRDRLGLYVSDFYRQEGATVADLRGRIAALFGEVRAELVATTEITRAAAEGEHGIIGDIEDANPGVAMTPSWETSMDEWVCKICGPSGLQGVAGQKRGDRVTYRSRDGRSYGSPPAHPRCRCGERWTAVRRRA